MAYTWTHLKYYLLQYCVQVGLLPKSLLNPRSLLCNINQPHILLRAFWLINMGTVIFCMHLIRWMNNGNIQTINWCLSNPQLSHSSSELFKYSDVMLICKILPVSCSELLCSFITYIPVGD